jgi:hypothetical protein
MISVLNLEYTRDYHSDDVASRSVTRRTPESRGQIVNIMNMKYTLVSKTANYCMHKYRRWYLLRFDSMNLNSHPYLPTLQLKCLHRHSPNPYPNPPSPCIPALSNNPIPAVTKLSNWPQLVKSAMILLSGRKLGLKTTDSGVGMLPAA